MFGDSGGALVVTIGLFILLAIVLVAALVLQAGLLAFAMYVLLGVLLLSRHLAKNTPYAQWWDRQAPPCG